MPAQAGGAGDSWAAGDAYEAYMGRWSRELARVFLAWLRPDAGGHWLEVGCGTGALTAAIAEVATPAEVVACDPSEAFIQHARRHAPPASSFQVVATADALPQRAGGFDAVVAGLALNFIPQPAQALAAMRARCRPGGTVAAYIWDYAGGVEFLQIFWEEVVAADAAASALDESRRFAAWQAPELAARFREAGLVQVETGVLETTTEFSDFADFWRPFLGGSGPAPSYVAALDPAGRESLRARLERRLGAGRLRLRARALAARGRR